MFKIWFNAKFVSPQDILEVEWKKKFSSTTDIGFNGNLQRKIQI